VGRDIACAVQAGPEANRGACTVGYRIFPRVKWPNSGVDQQPVSSAGLRMVRNQTATFPLFVHSHVMGDLRLFTFKMNETLCLFLARQPPVGQGLLINEVSRSHTTTHHSR
jgi:hypothetical protein